MPSRLVALTFDAVEPTRLGRFWGDVLGRDGVDHDGGVLLPGTDAQVGLRFVPGATRKVGLGRVHLHLTSTSLDDQQQTVATALERGASPLDVGQRPEEEHVVLADPEGNEFCVIEAGNSFLDGCGFLGELACEGTWAVGHFWAEALAWPLVWDQDEETAIQSPHGGTKVAWGGPPVAPKRGRNRQRFDLTVTDGDLGAEVDRLVALGARSLEASEAGSVELADPDGNEFRLTRG